MLLMTLGVFYNDVDLDHEKNDPADKKFLFSAHMNFKTHIFTAYYGSNSIF